MKVAFYVSDKRRDHDLADAFAGCFPVTKITSGRFQEGFDLHCIIGLKHRAVKEKIEAVGADWLYWDKGYFRDQWPHWWRISWCSQQPGYLIPTFRVDADRAEQQGWFSRLKPWRSDGNQIVLGGWSAKASQFLGIEEPNAYLTGVVKTLQEYTNRPIWYRAKPSYRDAAWIEGITRFTKAGSRPVGDDLAGAWALVTHSSGTALDAMLAGIPSICLGPAIVEPISSRDLAHIETPYMAPREYRESLLTGLAYLQWNLDELRSGAARRSLEGLFNEWRARNKICEGIFTPA